MQVTNFIPLILRKRNRHHDTVSPSRRSAVGTKRIRHIAGSASMFTVNAHRQWCKIIANINSAVRAGLCDKGLHLHVLRCHQSTRQTTQVDSLVALIDMIGLTYRRRRFCFP